MNNNTLLIKVRQRINKLGSYDYDNIEDWMVLEAFNKVQLEFARRECKKGESDTQTILDVQNLLTYLNLEGSNHNGFFESDFIPSNFLLFKRVSCLGNTKECTTLRKFKVYLGEESNLDDLLKDPNKNPNFKWAETFCTILGNKIRIYSNSKFSIETPQLVYYRKPIIVKKAGVTDMDLEDISTVDQICEFKDDIVELLIDETCIVLAGDIESVNQVQRLSQNIQRTE